MSHSHFGDLIEVITNRKEYKAHLVLDRGLEIILVHTTIGLWYKYSQGKWGELTLQESSDLVTQFCNSANLKSMMD